MNSVDIIVEEGQVTPSNVKAARMETDAVVPGEADDVGEPDLNRTRRIVEEKTPSNVSFFMLYSFADLYDCILLFLGTVAALTHGCSYSVYYLFFSRLINGLGANQNNPDAALHEVEKGCLYIIYLATVVFFASWAEIACWILVGERQASKIRIQYLEAILREDLDFFDTDAHSTRVVDSISSDTILLQDAISEKAGHFLHNMATFVGGLAIGFTRAWQLSLVILMAIPLIAFAGALFSYTFTRITSKSQEISAEVGTISKQVIDQIRTVYAFVGETKAIQSYSQSLTVALKLGYKAGFVKGLSLGVTILIIFTSWAAVFYFGGVFIRRGDTTAGTTVSTLLTVLIAGISLGKALSNLIAFSQGKAAGSRLINVIKRHPKIDRNDSSGTAIPRVEGHIELRKITFSYPSRPSVIIFKDFCLDIPSGKTVAIVGSSGSGKSTVISLIERFYDPLSGQVLLDGVDTRTLNLKWLREQIGLVNQEPALFATTILENILHGKEGATFQEVQQAAEVANVHGFISKLPQGYKTQVGERGAQLSGGQKQRIAISRAMLRNPKILLLDEATSALDVASESTVQQALDQVMIGRTTVVVAHRLSTIQKVDAIAVLENGEVVEMGNHEELMARGASGKYFRLVKQQQMEETVDDRIENRIVDCISSVRYSNTTSASYCSTPERKKFSFDYSAQDVGCSFMENTTDTEQKSTFRRLVKMNAPEWPYAILGAVGSMFTGLTMPLFAFFLSDTIKYYYYTDFEVMKMQISKVVLLLSGMGIANLGFQCLGNYCFGIVSQKLIYRLRQMMFSAILQNEVGWFDREENNSSHIASRLASDATNVQFVVSGIASLIIENTALILTAWTIALLTQWRMGIVVISIFPLIIFGIYCQQQSTKGFSHNIAEAHAKACMLMGDCVGNIRTVVAFNSQTKMLQLFSKEIQSTQRKSLLRGNMAGMLYGWSQCLMYCCCALSLWYGSRLVKSAVTDFAAVIKVYMVIMVSSFGVSQTFILAADFLRASGALSSVFSTIDRKTMIKPDDPDAEIVMAVRGDIEFNYVEFVYPSRPDTIILKNLNLRVESGTRLALVGGSGSGKSSIIALIQRFYDPVLGAVLIDGKNIRTLNLRSLRQHMALVQQEPALFATTIYENILYGCQKGETSMGDPVAAVEEAAKAANAHAFITALPEGYSTNVGERGVQLSGGQKQRIAIARAVLKDPAILLLDEATSALDAESEEAVQRTLERMMESRTTIIVAHRLSTIRTASTIAVLRDGQIVERGTHTTLIATQDGAYANLLMMAQAGGCGGK